MYTKDQNFKFRYYFMIFLMAFLVFLCSDTRYYHAFGDYIFNYMHIKAWSNGTKGTHLTLFYILPIVLILFVMLKNKVAPKAKVKGWKGITVFFLAIILMVNVTNFGVTLSKRFSDDLSSIVISEGKSKLSFSAENDNLKYFEAQFHLENLSKDSREFNIELVNPFDDGVSQIFVLNSEGEPALFSISGKTNRMITIDSDHYQIHAYFDVINGGGSSSSFIIRLIDKEGTIYELNTDGFMGIIL
ncbi:hypothetical protein QE109_09765 [Fusibacter bizertensis]|uniref:Uncharacterized protein n=1 Tax=Fusibacter bizertensis TaxID=1488331 RepID=A0ABT6NDD7_9FIRM|nr:hypothetical protein [Fusibacter bizertensis]MDH8678433.1 hypothetical protein [Fusibacter bizertensis]